MKKRIIILTLLSILAMSRKVSAQEVNFYFYPNGGSVTTDGFSVGDYGYINYNGNFFASYKEKETIQNINSIFGKTFSLEKNGIPLVKGREWYFTSISDGKVYFFNENNSYSVSQILNVLKLRDDDFISIDLYANWEDNKKTKGIDLSSKELEKPSIDIKSSKSKIAVGESLALQANFTPATAKKEKVAWTSSNTKIATVDSNGKVKGIKTGSVTITAKSSGGLKATKTITITPKTNVVIIRYHKNYGGLLSDHGKAISLQDGYIKFNDSIDAQKINYGESLGQNGLANYNNPNNVNIGRTGYTVVKGQEWNTKRDGSGKSYSQTKVYKASEFCDASKKDCIVTLYVNWKKEKKDRIHFINMRKSNKDSVLTGQGDAILLESEGKYAMIDSGLYEGRDVVYNYLKSHGVQTLEFLVITHNHHDHDGSAVYLDEKPDLKIKKVYMKHYLGNDRAANIEDMKSRYDSIVRHFSNRIVYVDTNAKYKESSSNIGRVALGNMKVDFYNTAQRLQNKPSQSVKEYKDFWTESYFSVDENPNSIANLININKHNILLTGDIDSYKVLNGLFQKRIVGKIKKLDLLKIPHHGVENCAGAWTNKDQKTNFYLPVLADNYIVTNSSSVATITADYSVRNGVTRNSCYNNLFNNDKKKAKQALCKSYFSQDSDKAVVFDFTKADTVKIDGGGQGKASICK